MVREYAQNAWSVSGNINNHCLSILKARAYTSHLIEGIADNFSIGLLICGTILELFVIADFSIALCPANAYGTSCDHSAGFITFTVGILMILVSVGLIAVAIQRAELKKSINKAHRIVNIGFVIR